MKFFTLALLSATALSATAQITGDGFYRAINIYSSRYITVIDNRTKGANYQTSQVDVNALRSIRPFDERVVNDPGTVLYFKNKGTNSSGDPLYDLEAQGVDTYKLVSAHLALTQNANGSYRAYGQQTVSGTLWTAYLADTPTDQVDIAYLTTGSSNAKNWNIVPVSAASDNYFGLKPTLNIGDKYYTTLFADFAFEPYSSGIKVYYIDAWKDGAGKDYAELKEITGRVPANTPVIIECSSNQASDNRLELYYDQTAAPSDNLLRGVYFENITVYEVGVNSGHQNALAYDASTMRVLGKVNGELGFVTSSKLNYVPANSAYLLVPADTDAKVLCLPADQYATAISSLQAEAPASPSAIFNLMGQQVSNTDVPGIYIINGKKVVVR